MRLRICIKERLREWHYHDEIFAEKLELAANEAFCNIIEHGYSFSKNGKILVEINREKEGVSLEFYDKGVSIDPERLKDADSAKEKGRSFGLYIIKTACDHIEYEAKKSPNEWNRLKLYKAYSIRG
jgi:anti-sigma regulatory factor (Ser/Thr protein kinase)